MNEESDIGISGRTYPGLIVSNGRDVTVADAEGNYRLPFWGLHVYCVAAPGYSPFDGAVVPLTTPDRAHDILPARVKHPTGEFVFAEMADCHLDERPSSPVTPAVFEAALRQVQAEANPDFVVLAGDQVQRRSIKALHLVCDVLDRVGLPAVQVNGNHEGQCSLSERNKIRREVAATTASEDEMANFFTRFGPTRFAFFWGRYLFLIVDAMSSFAPDQHRWLKSLLALVSPETPLVVSIHHPEMAFLWFPELFDRNLRLVISGHYHRHVAFTQDGVLHSSASSALMAGCDGFPPGYRFYRMPVSGEGRITYETTNLNCDPALRKVLIKQIGRPHQTADAGPLKACWRQQLDGAVKCSEPVVCEGRIVVAPYDLDADPIGRLQVFDSESGKLLWVKRLGHGFFGTPAICEGYVPELDSAGMLLWNSAMRDDSSETPATSDSHIFAQSITGQVYCISLAAGNILVQQELGPRAARGFTGRVVIEQDLVLVGDAGCFAAFNRYVGQQQWIWPEDPLARIGSFYTAGTAVGSGVVLVGSDAETEGVVAVDVQTGRCRWRSGDSKNPRRGDCVFDRDFYFFSPRALVCLAGKTGQVKWMTPSDPWSHSAPLVHRGKVFAAGSSGDLQALDREPGRELWRIQLGKPLLTLAYNQTEPSGQLAGPVACGDYVLQASNDGNLYAVDAETGNTEWQHDFGIALTSTPVVCDDHIFMPAPDATLWKFKHDLL